MLNINDLENINLNLLMKIKLKEEVIKNLKNKIEAERKTTNNANKISYYDLHIKKMELGLMELYNSVDNNMNLINNYKDSEEFGVSAKRMK